MTREIDHLRVLHKCCFDIEIRPIHATVDGEGRVRMLEYEDGLVGGVGNGLVKLRLEPLDLTLKGLAVVIIRNADEVVAVDDGVGIHILADELLIDVVADGGVVVTVLDEFMVAHANKCLSIAHGVVIYDLHEHLILRLSAAAGHIAGNYDCVEALVALGRRVVVGVVIESGEALGVRLILLAAEVDVAANGEAQHGGEVLGHLGGLLIHAADKRIYAEIAGECGGDDRVDYSSEINIHFNFSIFYYMLSGTEMLNMVSTLRRTVRTQRQRLSLACMRDSSSTPTRQAL